VFGLALVRDRSNGAPSSSSTRSPVGVRGVMFRGVLPATRTPTREAASAGLSNEKPRLSTRVFRFRRARRSTTLSKKALETGRTVLRPRTATDSFTALDRSNGFVKHFLKEEENVVYLRSSSRYATRARLLEQPLHLEDVVPPDPAHVPPPQRRDVRLGGLPRLGVVHRFVQDPPRAKPRV